MLRLSCPGKVFLLGEYAVLRGGPALLWATGPRFELTVPGGTRPEPGPSPRGRMVTWCEGEGLRPPMYDFRDPLGGKGGFGASTAEFLLLYAGMTGELDWEHAYAAYREITAAETSALPPSGADLVAQARGGLTLFRPSQYSVEDLPTATIEQSLLIFSATDIPGRKVATHEHLAGAELARVVAALPAGELEAIIESAVDAIRAGGPEAAGTLGACIRRYGDALATAGLEHPATGEDRRALAAIPGVLGTKGAGALQSDAVLAVVTPAARAHAIQVAQARGLRWIGDLKSEPGLREDHSSPES